MKKLLTTENILLIFILAVATTLRFYNYQNLFVHFDEFSAFFRTGFTNFGALIQKGVIETDTHPAGVQVFLNYWVQLFGTNMELFKLPFVLMGIASIYMGFKLGKLWFNPTVGFIVALFIGFTQYGLTYTLFARPYASGLFFSLMMVWFWSRSFIIVEGNFKRNLVGYILFGALCAYDHYFALFLLALVWISGWIVIKRNQYLTYILSGVAIFILFIPHLNIFFIQLRKGGVESWLAKPTPDFFIEYLRYILHFSVWMYVLVGLLWVYSLIGIRKRSDLFRKQLILLFWILTTYLVAYFYSIYRSAVLQYSVLFFTFPFLIMLVFSFMKKLKPIMNVLIIIVFLLVSFYSLIADRHYFYVMYNSGYEQLLSESNTAINDFGEPNITVQLNLPDHLKKYYLDELNLPDKSFLDLNNFETFQEFENFLDSINTNYLIIGGAGFLHPEFIKMAEDHFPYMITEKNWFLCDWYLFSKTQPANYQGPADQIIFSFDKDYNLNPPHGINIDSSQEYFNLADFDLDTLLSHKNNWINLKLGIVGEKSIETAKLVSEVRVDNEVILWQGTDLKDFEMKNDEPFDVYQSFKLSDIKKDIRKAQLKVYIWNPGFESFKLKSFNLEVRDGNPFLYSLFEEIPR